MRFTSSLVALGLIACSLLALFSVSSCQSGALQADVGKIVIRRALSADPKTLDPHKAGDVVSSTQCGLVYEQLFEYHYFDRPARIIPCLASEVPSVENGGILEDGHVYKIKIRKGVLFQDDPCFPDGKGREMVASDVVYSIKRFASLSDTSGWWIANEKIEGLDAFRSFATSSTSGITDGDIKSKVMEQVFDREVSGLSADDEKGLVTIRLTAPYLQFLAVNCMSYFAIIPHEAVTKYGDQLFQNPVGTGPFRLRHWDYKRELVWERNPNFREQKFPEVPANHKAVDGAREASAYKQYVGKMLPLADEVRFRVIPESQASWLEFKNGTLDATGMDSDQFSEAVQNDSLTGDLKEKGISLAKYDRPIIEYLVFNMKDPVWGTPGGEKAKAMRKAVALCLDRKHYIKEIQNGRGKIANMLVSPQFVGFDKDYEYPFSKMDLELGRKYLKDAGFELSQNKEGHWVALDPDTGQQPNLTFLLRGTSSTSVKTAEQLTFGGNAVGIKINCENLQFPEFLKRQREGSGQAYNAGWVFDYPDAQNILTLLYGKNAKPNGVNAARYQSKAYDELYDAMNSLDQNDPVQKKQKEEIILKMHDVLKEDCPWALIYFGKNYALSHEWYSPPMPNDFAYNLTKYYSADSELRAKRADEWSEVVWFPAILIVSLMLLFSGLFVYKVLMQP